LVSSGLWVDFVYDENLMHPEIQKAHTNTQVQKLREKKREGKTKEESAPYRRDDRRELWIGRQRPSAELRLPIKKLAEKKKKPQSPWDGDWRQGEDEKE
jgi:hypothetical protein